MAGTSRRSLAAFVAALSLFAPRVGAQGTAPPAGAPAGAPVPAVPSAASGSARATAPFDYTGYWVSVVTEKWRYRMLVPDKNDYTQVPLNPEGRRVAGTWDPAKDQASGEACRGYGAAALLQVPGRLHITWQDDNTLRMDTDSGTQTRLFHFTALGNTALGNTVATPRPAQPSWQGYSVAEWGGGEPRDRRDGQGGPTQDAAGKLIVTGGQRKPADYLGVVTTRMRPGYLQKNGVPYSADALLEEYFDTFTDPYTKNTWLVVTTVVTDPHYLIEPLVMHAHFKKLPEASGWDPTQCNANEAR